MGCRRLLISGCALVTLVVACAEARQLTDWGQQDSWTDSSIVSNEQGTADLDGTSDLPQDLRHTWDTCSAECAGKCKGEDDGCGKPCPVNQCWGCCSGNKCRTGDQHKLCGKMGEPCLDCVSSIKDECNEGACVTGGKCDKKPRPDGYQCAGGVCRNGSCCKGCWTGVDCKGGISPTYCGSKGAVCVTCAASGSCQTATCATGACVKSWRPFGWGCPSGKCLHGQCCTGCISGSTCHAGTGHGNCGLGGGPCQACWWNQNCNGGICSQ